MPEITLRNDFRPGDMGYIIYLVGDIYAREYGMGEGLRAVLRSTSRDAEIRKPLEITRIGGRE